VREGSESGGDIRFPEEPSVGREAGVASFRAATPPEADLGDARFGKVFAINVGMFWRQRLVRELAIIGDHLAPGGRLFLFYESPPGSAGPPDAGPAVALLEDNGFAFVEILSQELQRTSVGCVISEKG
jgi:hypothetical protein